MPRFKHYNYDQSATVVINYQEQLQPGTFEHAVHYLIENKLGLSVFHPKYCNEDTGWLAYDSAILLKIILFAYSKGITSSREMQWCCQWETTLWTASRFCLPWKAVRRLVTPLPHSSALVWPSMRIAILRMTREYGI